MSVARPGRLRRAWRSPSWYRPVGAIAALLVAVAFAASTWLNFAYREDRLAAFDVQQREVVALRAELTCRNVESSTAVRIEGEITREGWRAMVRFAETGDGGDPVIVAGAARIRGLYAELGPALEERAAAVETCQRAAAAAADRAAE